MYRVLGKEDVMKRTGIVFLVVLILGLLSGCGTAVTSTDRGKDADQKVITSPAGEDNGSVSEKNGTSEANTDTGIDPSDVSQQNDNSGSQSGAEVIAKSTNIVSSQEKAAVLDEISKELDNMIESINNVEDVADEDLDF